MSKTPKLLKLSDLSNFIESHLCLTSPCHEYQSSESSIASLSNLLKHNLIEIENNKLIDYYPGLQCSEDHSKESLNRKRTYQSFKDPYIHKAKIPKTDFRHEDESKKCSAKGSLKIEESIEIDGKYEHASCTRIYTPDYFPALKELSSPTGESGIVCDEVVVEKNDDGDGRSSSLGSTPLLDERGRYSPDSLKYSCTPDPYTGSFEFNKLGKWHETSLLNFDLRDRAIYTIDDMPKLYSIIDNMLPSATLGPKQQQQQNITKIFEKENMSTCQQNLERMLLCGDFETDQQSFGSSLNLTSSLPVFHGRSKTYSLQTNLSDSSTLNKKNNPPETKMVLKGKASNVSNCSSSLKDDSVIMTIKSSTSCTSKNSNTSSVKSHIIDISSSASKENSSCEFPTKTNLPNTSPPVTESVEMSDKYHSEVSRKISYDNLSSTSDFIDKENRECVFLGSIDLLATVPSFCEANESINKYEPSGDFEKIPHDNICDADSFLHSKIEISKMHDQIPTIMTETSKPSTNGEAKNESGMKLIDQVVISSDSLSNVKLSCEYPTRVATVTTSFSVEAHKEYIECEAAKDLDGRITSDKLCTKGTNLAGESGLSGCLDNTQQPVIEASKTSSFGGDVFTMKSTDPMTEIDSINKENVTCKFLGSVPTSSIIDTTVITARKEDPAIFEIALESRLTISEKTQAVVKNQDSSQKSASTNYCKKLSSNILTTGSDDPFYSENNSCEQVPENLDSPCITALVVKLNKEHDTCKIAHESVVIACDTGIVSEQVCEVDLLNIMPSPVTVQVSCDSSEMQSSCGATTEKMKTSNNICTPEANIINMSCNDTGITQANVSHLISEGDSYEENHVGYFIDAVSATQLESCEIIIEGEYSDTTHLCDEPGKQCFVDETSIEKKMSLEAAHDQGLDCSASYSVASAVKEVLDYCEAPFEDICTKTNDNHTLLNTDNIVSKSKEDLDTDLLIISLSGASASKQPSLLQADNDVINSNLILKLNSQTETVYVNAPEAITTESVESEANENNSLDLNMHVPLSTSENCTDAESAHNLSLNQISRETSFSSNQGNGVSIVIQNEDKNTQLMTQVHTSLVSSPTKLVVSLPLAGLNTTLRYAQFLNSSGICDKQGHNTSSCVDTSSPSTCFVCTNVCDSFLLSETVAINTNTTNFSAKSSSMETSHTECSATEETEVIRPQSSYAVASDNDNYNHSESVPCTSVTDPAVNDRVEKRVLGIRKKLNPKSTAVQDQPTKTLEEDEALLSFDDILSDIQRAEEKKKVKQLSLANIEESYKAISDDPSDSRLETLAILYDVALQNNVALSTDETSQKNFDISIFNPVNGFKFFSNEIAEELWSGTISKPSSRFEKKLSKMIYSGILDLLQSDELLYCGAQISPRNICSLSRFLWKLMSIHPSQEIVQKCQSSIFLLNREFDTKYLPKLEELIGIFINLGISGDSCPLTKSFSKVTKQLNSQAKKMDLHFCATTNKNDILLCNLRVVIDTLTYTLSDNSGRSLDGSILLNLFLILSWLSCDQQIITSVAGPCLSKCLDTILNSFTNKDWEEEKMDSLTSHLLVLGDEICERILNMIQLFRSTRRGKQLAIQLSFHFLHLFLKRKSYGSTISVESLIGTLRLQNLHEIKDYNRLYWVLSLVEACVDLKFDGTVEKSVVDLNHYLTFLKSKLNGRKGIGELSVRNVLSLLCTMQSKFQLLEECQLPRKSYLF